MTHPRPTKPIRLWCVVSPRGRIKSESRFRSDCYDWILRNTRETLGETVRFTLARARRDGWRVRRLKPEEVEP